MAVANLYRDDVFCLKKEYRLLDTKYNKISAKILLVEDEKMLAETTKAYLENLGYEVLAIESTGEDAVKTALQKLPDIILMDIKLSGIMDGIKAAKIINEKSEIPIIFLTAVQDDELFQKAKITAPFGYIIKPVNYHNLQLNIELALYKSSMEKVLATSNEKYRSLIQTIPDIVFYVNTEGKFIYLNKTIGLLGYSPEELIGKHYSCIMHPEDIDKMSRNIVLPRYNRNENDMQSSPKLFDERRTIWRATKNMEVRLLHKDESKKGIDVEINTSGYYDKDVVEKEKVFLGTVGIIRDITERKKIEIEKKHYQEHLLNSEKLISLGKLAGGMAHEINNPLTSVLSTAEMLVENIPEKEELFNDLEQIIYEAKRIKDTVKNFLVFAKSRKYVFAQENIYKIIENSLKIIGRGMLNNFKVEKDFDKSIGKIKLSKFHMEEIFINVITNALHSMKDKGILTIVVSKEEDYVKISIKDTGEGIVRENLDKVFEPYFSTKEKRGTGLGLSTCKLVMEKHDGSISIKSGGPGKGAECILHLPDTNARKEFFSKLKILVIDDEETIRKTIKKALNRNNYLIDCVGTSEDGLLCMKDKRYDLVVVDYDLPGINGLEFLEIIHNKYPAVKSILNTGSSDKTVFSAALCKGCVSFISKPFQVSDIREKVEKALISDKN
ncbi:response regulator [Elusimicrobiota bacterium]